MSTHATWVDTGLKQIGLSHLEGGDLVRYRVNIGAGQISGSRGWLGSTFTVHYRWMGTPVVAHFNVISREGPTLIVERYESSGFGD